MDSTCIRCGAHLGSGRGACRVCGGLRREGSRQAGLDDWWLLLLLAIFGGASALLYWLLITIITG